MNNAPTYENTIPEHRWCSDCENENENIDSTMNLRVLYTPAGYYLGFWCDNHGEYSRETHHVRTREEAEKMLKRITEKHNGKIN